MYNEHAKTSYQVIPGCIICEGDGARTLDRKTLSTSSYVSPDGKARSLRMAVRRYYARARPELGIGGFSPALLSRWTQWLDIPVLVHLGSYKGSTF